MRPSASPEPGDLWLRLARFFGVLCAALIATYLLLKLLGHDWLLIDALGVACGILSMLCLMPTTHN